MQHKPAATERYVLINVAVVRALGEYIYIQMDVAMVVLYLLAECPPFGWVPSLSIERVFFKC